jgi:hypothetical protein
MIVSERPDYVRYVGSGVVVMEMGLGLPRLGVDRNLDIHFEYALDYGHVGLAPVAGIARTPSFEWYSPKRDMYWKDLYA